MGSESSKSNSNSSKSDSDSSSNSGNKSGNLETMDCQKENDNTIIYRVWIVKKSITLNDRHINLDSVFQFLLHPKDTIIDFFNGKLKFPKLIKPEINIFDIENETKWYFKHWAIILELSNDSYVNIQFGRDGFSLKEFNKTSIDGENILDSIKETWGEKAHPFSFCYLGNANFEYEKFKQTLKIMKDEEIKSYTRKGNIYYNLFHRNCQHFVCDIEKILFNEIKVCHSFDYYLDGFFNKFFPDVDIDILKSKYTEKINEKNEEIYLLNNESLIEYLKIEPNNLYNLYKLNKDIFIEYFKIERNNS